MTDINKTESKPVADQSVVHTPGPWEVYSWAKTQPLAGRAASVFSSANNDEQAICDLIQLPSPAALEQEANARLIAAAPELLAACIDANSKINDCANGKINFRHDFGDRLRTAIANAKYPAGSKEHFMEFNGLGPEDMENDLTYPPTC